MKWWSYRRLRCSNSSSTRGDDGRATARIITRRVAVGVIVVLANSKVDADGDTSDNNDGGDGDQDLVLGLHGPLFTLIGRHFCVLGVSGIWIVEWVL